MRTAVLFVVLFSAGFGVSRTLARPPPEAPPLQAAAAAIDHPDCVGGAEAPLHVKLVPEAIEQGGGGDVLTASAQVEHLGQGKATVGYSLEVVSDTGASMLRAPGLTRRLEKKGSLPPGLLRTPKGLPDGFYQARVVAHAQGDEGETELMDHLYFEVSKGSLTLIEADDFYARSRINEAVAQ